MKFRNIYKKALISVTGFGAMLLIGGSAMAQDSPRDEHEEWQSAKRETANELREYKRNPTRDNYRGYQEALKDDRREYAEYQTALRRNRGVAGNRNAMYGELNQESPRDEYEEWQSAKRELANELREYKRNPTRDNLRGYQDAKRDERREYAEYQAALRNSGVSRRNW